MYLDEIDDVRPQLAVRQALTGKMVKPTEEEDAKPKYVDEINNVRRQM